MKTIEEALNIAYNECKSNAYFGNGFKKGVEFAQKWIPIERDKDGFTTLNQQEEFLKNFPILVKGNYGIELLDELTTDLEKPRYGYTHWRPVNLK